MITSAGDAAEGRIDKWVKRRHGLQSSPQLLHSKRIYILPSKSGIVFAIMLFVMLIGSMNYNNSMALALTFLLASLMLVSMHQCHRNLLELKVSFSSPAPVFRGQNVSIPITLVNTKQLLRQDLRLSNNKQNETALNLGEQQSQSLELLFPSEHRGVLKIPRLHISCRYPGGLFRAWTWVYWEMETLIYPAPQGQAALPAPRAGTNQGNSVSVRGDEEFGELRDYQRGDNLNRVAWKQLARSDALYTKVFEDNAATELSFDVGDLQDLDSEAQLEQLTQWVVLADQQELAFALRLKDQEFAVNSGPDHVRKCLRALALQP